MIGKNEEMRKAAGQPPGYCFLDGFALNQVAIDNQSANTHQTNVGQLARDYRDTLLDAATIWCYVARLVPVEGARLGEGGGPLACLVSISVGRIVIL